MVLLLVARVTGVQLSKPFRVDLANQIKRLEEEAAVVYKRVINEIVRDRPSQSKLYKELWTHVPGGG